MSQAISREPNQTTHGNTRERMVLRIDLIKIRLDSRALSAGASENIHLMKISERRENMTFDIESTEAEKDA